MIGPVSNTGRAMMASLQQAMQKGMPPDQAIQYVKSMAVEGVAPLTDLYAMMNQFQRLKQQQVKPPQNPPTIKDQLNMLDQQSGIASVQPQGPAPEMMDRGLGAIDAGSMNSAQYAGGFAGGGSVVALAQGGDFDIEDIYSRGKPKGADQFDIRALYQFSEQASPEELARMYAKALSQNDFDTASRLEPAMIKRGLSQEYINYVRRNTALGVSELRQVKEQEPVNKILYGAAAGPVPTAVPDTSTVPPAPPTPTTPPTPNIVADTGVAPPPPEKDVTEEQYARLQAFRQREGLGKAREEMSQFLTDEERRLEKTYGEDRRLAFAETGFRMAQAASRPGATFLGALSEGAISGTQALRGINKELNENKRLLKQSMIKLREAAEMEKEGDYKTAMGLNKEARAEALKLYEIREGLKSDRMKIASMDRQTAASREYTQAYRDEAANTRKLQLRERILENSNYPMLQTQLQNVKPDDTETQQRIQSQMNAIMREASVRAGLPEEAAVLESGPAMPAKYRYDIQSGRMIPIG
jgi:hypothetical protein